MSVEQLFLVTSLNDLKALAEVIQRHWRKGVVLRLWGDLGVGKTTLVGFLVGDGVASPTYAIHHHYETPSGPVEHLDLYRLETSEELESAGVWEIIDTQGSRIVVEWPDRVDDGDWPKNKTYLDVHMVLDKNQRHIRIKLPA